MKTTSFMWKSSRLVNRSILCIEGLVLVVFSTAVVCAQDVQEDACIFDANYFSEADIYKREYVLGYKWDEENKVASILLKSGDYVHLKRWACNSRGSEATMLIVQPDMKYGSDYWFDQLLIFSERFMDKSAFMYFNERLGIDREEEGVEMDFERGIELDYSNAEIQFPEFYLLAKIDQGLARFYFYYYQN